MFIFNILGQEKYIKPSKILCDYIYNAEKTDQDYVDMIVYFIKKNSQIL